VAVTESAMGGLLTKLWRRMAGMEPGYYVTLNPDVEAAETASRERIEALETALAAVDGVYSRENNAAVKTLEAMLAHERDVLADLPEVERVLAPGPNPSMYQSVFAPLTVSPIATTRPWDGKAVTFPVEMA
jgi:hypothetical protein